MKDPIVEEIHKTRRKIEAECDHDWGKLLAYYRRAEKAWAGPVVSRAGRKAGLRASGRKR
jgi:hypothetical protein